MMAGTDRLGFVPVFYMPGFFLHDGARKAAREFRCFAESLY